MMTVGRITTLTPTILVRAPNFHFFLIGKKSFLMAGAVQKRGQLRILRPFFLIGKTFLFDPF